MDSRISCSQKNKNSFAIAAPIYILKFGAFDFPTHFHSCQIVKYKIVLKSQLSPLLTGALTSLLLKQTRKSKQL
jgi:hypothetical protein